MKQYVIDELRPDDHAKLEKYLKSNLQVGALEGVYRLPLDDEQLSHRQASHHACKPFYVALELTPSALVCELLVRCSQKIRCDCIAYAEEQMRNQIIDTIDTILTKLKIQA